MKETTRITKLFEDLYDGDPWIGVTLLPTLQQLTSKQASKRIYANWNTIWEITNHLISWRENVLQRLHGKVIKTPSHNYILPVTDASPEAWNTTLQRLEKSQQDWTTFLKNFNSSDFEKIYAGNQMTYYEHIQGILQHDAYHLGQIVILAKRVGP
jgi:uncharacterized damage-inducible protein DinB